MRGRPPPRRRRSRGLGGDVTDVLSEAWGVFTASEQAQGSMTQAQLDATAAIQQQQQTDVLLMVGMAAVVYFMVKS
jgi:hypothetical protein